MEIMARREEIPSRSVGRNAQLEGFASQGYLADHDSFSTIAGGCDL